MGLKVLTHFHTENSKHDSAAFVEDMVKCAAELGAEALAISEHGVLTSIEDFMDACEKYEVKGIPGVEAYYEEDDSTLGRSHLVLYPKDIIGYTAISKAVTASNTRLKNGCPRMNLDILNQYFGHDAIGHDHVIATTACVSGILGTILLSAEKKHNEMQKIKDRTRRLNNPNDPKYLDALNRIEEIDQEKKDLTIKRKDLKKLADTKFLMKEKKVEKLQGTSGYEVAKKELEKQKQEAKKAKEELKLLDQKKNQLTTQRRKLKEFTEPYAKDVEKWERWNTKLEELQQSVKTEKEMYQLALDTAKTFDQIFGHGNLYAELQFHGLDMERYVMPKVLEIARSLDLPLIAANDAHMVSNSEEEVRARAIMRSLRFNKWSEPQASDKELYIKTDEELSYMLNLILPDDAVKEAMQGCVDMANQCHVVFQKANHFPKYQSEIEGETADEALEREAYAGIPWRFPKKEQWNDTYQKRLEYELDVMKTMGYADYHLIVKDFLKIGRLLGRLSDQKVQELKDNCKDMSLKEFLGFIHDNAVEVGLGVGPGRGSAAGSLVCYLLGITNIDPLKYDLLFERFLNVERVSMPDIDSDFKTDIRELVLEYVKKQYGEDAVCCIMTKGRQVAKGTIRNCARILGSELYQDETFYYDLGGKIASEIPNEVGIQLSDCVYDQEEVDEQGKKTVTSGLFTKFKDEPAAIRIINDSLLVENRLTNYGMHAAGVIIADNGDVKEYTPLMWNTDNKVFTTQCDKERAEEKGLLKMDFLGLKNLNVITDTMRLIKERTGKTIDVENLPFDADVLKNIFSNGLTNGVFQFESDGMKNMLKQFQPTSFEDLILLVAAYRPGPMQYLDNIIKIKHRKAKLTYLTPELQPILGTTYGSIIYQEQVQQIFQKLAGYSLGQADLVRRAMSKKKTKILNAERTAFIHGDASRNITGCIANHIDEKVADTLFDQMTEFAKYAFNKSHAAAYAMVAYITAWLKYHYHTEYLTSVLNYTKPEDFVKYKTDIDFFKIKLLPPNVETSDEKFSIVDDQILYGLASIKGVVSAASTIINERNRMPFTSFQNFYRRVSVRQNVLENLITSGAFDCFTNNRAVLKSMLTNFKEIKKKIEEKTKLIQELKEIEANGFDDEKQQRQWQRRMTNAQSTLDEQTKMFDELIIPHDIPENYRYRLDQEKELLGIYVTGHPLDEFEDPTQYDYGVSIANVEINKDLCLIGVVTNLRIVQRKKDQKNMCFFDLEDKTGVIKVSVFTNEYEDFATEIRVGNVVRIQGQAQERKKFNSNDIEVNFILKQAVELTPQKKPLVLEVKDVMTWANDMYLKVIPYQTENGHPLCLFDQLTGEIRKTDLKLSKSILENQRFHGWMLQ